MRVSIGNYETYINISTIEKRNNVALILLCVAFEQYKIGNNDETTKEFGLSEEDILCMRSSIARDILQREYNKFVERQGENNQVNQDLLNLMQDVIDKNDGEKAWMILKSRFCLKADNVEIIQAIENIDIDQIARIPIRINRFEEEE